MCLFNATAGTWNVEKVPNLFGSGAKGQKGLEPPIQPFKKHLI